MTAHLKRCLNAQYPQHLTKNPSFEEGKSKFCVVFDHCLTFPYEITQAFYIFSLRVFFFFHHNVQFPPGNKPEHQK